MFRLQKAFWYYPDPALDLLLFLFSLLVTLVVVVVVVCRDCGCGCGCGCSGGCGCGCGCGCGGCGCGGEGRMTTDVYCIFACLSGRNFAFKMLKHHPPEPQNCHLKSPETDASGNFLKPFWTVQWKPESSNRSQFSAMKEAVSDLRAPKITALKLRLQNAQTPSSLRHQQEAEESTP